MRQHQQMYETDMQRTTRTVDETDRPDPPDDAEHFVLFHRELTDGREGVVYEPGDELPADLAARVWSAFNDRIAAFDARGRRVDTPAENEPGMDTTGLQAWAWETASTSAADRHVCATCNQVFATEASLHGHQSKHTTPKNAPDEDADAVDGDTGGTPDSDAVGDDGRGGGEGLPAEESGDTTAAATEGDGAGSTVVDGEDA